MEGQKKFSIATALFCQTVAVFLCRQIAVAQVDQLAINEIMYDPPGADERHEWLEVYNLTTTDIDLTGYKLNDGSNHILNTPPKNGGQGGLLLPAGEFLIIADNAEQFKIDYPNIAASIIDSSFSLKNTAGAIKIIAPDGQVAAIQEYAATDGGNGDGFSLEKKELNGQVAWQSSVVLGGTPGQVNSSVGPVFVPQAPEIETITSGTSETEMPAGESPSQPNELLQAEAGPNATVLVGQPVAFDAAASTGKLKYFFWNFGDGATLTGQAKATHIYRFPGTYLVSLTVGDGTGESTDVCQITVFHNFIRITEFLPFALAADAENEWIEIYNQGDTPVFLDGWEIDDEEKGSRSFVFPQNSLIAGQSYLVLPRPTTKIALNNDHDTVRLFLPSGDLIQEIKYEQAPKGKSAAVFADNDFYWTAISTPGHANFPAPEKISAQNSISHRVSEVQKMPPVFSQQFNLIPTVWAASVKNDDVFSFAWQRAEQALSGSVDFSTNLQTTIPPAKNTQPIAAGDVNNFKKQLQKISRQSPKLPLLVLLASLFFSLFLFGGWFLRWVKK
ncbi:MAG: hypothetical protein COU85_02840 [Candidatus Portnoybacteria bacterium CG10_big_fil_rev_8_21_14_0_10_44_7]|uniref:PKD domain-containing protein n=1 Tax=Candidatus Portnoybacteria bacterium CG10_big_fil_rev_8_21_14_0_10_44_7 TaxID=1974816 RepID=A0A2M8KI34_9BACT|nr:MAG: hypothetical protein COU85_02840 [Candidatus Portnoybacteria bacterium CG10_big_fil_rev_8_21_14_0_10_44_7]